jgi:hypothetical protein
MDGQGNVQRERERERERERRLADAGQKQIPEMNYVIDHSINSK